MKSLLTRKSMLIAALAILLVGTTITATLAYLSDREEAMVNTFKTGSITTEIEEEFEQESATTFRKEPVVVNTGDSDCYVRARVLASPAEALKLYEFSSNWTLKEDGFYYYNSILPAKTAQSEAGKTDALFKKVEVTDTTIDGFEVTVYQEAVQTVVYTENGVLDRPDEIWAWYDNGGKESVSQTASDNT